MSFRSVLFAAGRGTRLRPLSDHVPKPALPLLDVPLGAFGLASLRRDAPPVIVNVSHLAERARAALAPWGGADTSFIVEAPIALGTGGTLAALRPQLESEIVTWNADVLSSVDLEHLHQEHRRSGAAATLSVVAVSEQADLHVVAGRVRRLFDRRRRRPAGHVFTGVAIIERHAITAIVGNAPVGLTEGLLRPLIRRGEIAAVDHGGFFLDVGTPSRYLRASLAVLDGRIKPPGDLPGRRVDVDGGRAYVGPRTEARGWLGPGAILLEGSTVMPDARVERAVVWPGEVVPRGETVRDTVFAPSTLRPAPT